MILNDNELAVQVELMGCVERALESLRKSVKNPRNFAIFSESYVDQLNLLKAEIEEYLARKKSSIPEVQIPQVTPGQQPINVA